MTNVNVARVNMLSISISIKYSISYYCQSKSNRLTTLLDCV